VRNATGAADRTEYIENLEKHYLAPVCEQLWTKPQVNFDGEVLGCCVNHWGSFGNAFRDDLLDVINNDKLNHARLMLQGKAPERDDVPCSSCKVYQQMKQHDRWITAPGPEPISRILSILKATYRRMFGSHRRAKGPRIELKQPTDRVV
jgi:hypothetical protein